MSRAQEVRTIYLKSSLFISAFLMAFFIWYNFATYGHAMPVDRLGAALIVWALVIFSYAIWRVSRTTEVDAA